MKAIRLGYQSSKNRITKLDQWTLASSAFPQIQQKWNRRDELEVSLRPLPETSYAKPPFSTHSTHLSKNYYDCFFLFLSSTHIKWTLYFPHLSKNLWCTTSFILSYKPQTHQPLGSSAASERTCTLEDSSGLFHSCTCLACFGSNYQLRWAAEPEASIWMHVDHLGCKPGKWSEGVKAAGLIKTTWSQLPLWQPRLIVSGDPQRTIQFGPQIIYLKDRGRGYIHWLPSPLVCRWPHSVPPYFSSISELHSLA